MSAQGNQATVASDYDSDAISGIVDVVTGYTWDAEASWYFEVDFQISQDAFVPVDLEHFNGDLTISDSQGVVFETNEYAYSGSIPLVGGRDYQLVVDGWSDQSGEALTFSVPEPGRGVMLAAGVAALGLARIRRR